MTFHNSFDSPIVSPSKQSINIRNLIFPTFQTAISRENEYCCFQKSAVADGIESIIDRTKINRVVNRVNEGTVKKRHTKIKT